MGHVSITATRRLAVLLASTGLLLTGAVVSAAPASADVLISGPSPDRVCVGANIKVGVWYQSYSGGPRSYRVSVYRPDGKRVFHAHGKAPSKNWRYWKVRTHDPGRYKTVFRSGRNVDNQWRVVGRTRAIRC